MTAQQQLGPYNPGAINVNSLISTPFVGDGVTSNAVSYSQLKQAILKTNPEFPVQVTITVGNPTIINLVTDTFHGIDRFFVKPNNAFYLYTSAGGALPTGITPFTTYYVTAAGLTDATQQSFAFSATNNYDWHQTEGSQVASSGITSGIVFLVFTGRKVDLTFPSGAYLQGDNTGLNITPNGVNRIRWYGYGARFNPLTPFGNPHSMSFGPKTWNVGNGGVFDLIATTPNNNTSANDGVLTLLTPANTANYYIGQWVCVLGFDPQGGLNAQSINSNGANPNAQYCEYKQIKSISSPTITLDGPLRFVRLSTFPIMGPSGPAMILPMHPCWDMELEIHGATFTGNPTAAVARRILFNDCEFNGFDNYPGAMAIGNSQQAIFRKCRFKPGDRAFALFEVDKCMEYLEFDNCEGYKFTWQSPAANLTVLKNCRGGLCYGTSKNFRAIDCDFDQFILGTQGIGTTDNVKIDSSRVTNFDMMFRNDDPAQLAPNNNDSTLLPNWTFSNGRLTRNFTGYTGDPAMNWAVPGAKLFFIAASANTPAKFQNLGLPFAVLNTVMDGSNNVTVDTTLKAIPTLQTSATVTISIASPAVFTFGGSAPANGTSAVLTTTGALPGGFSISTVYYVVNSTGAGGTCNLSATVGGAAINSTGSQSGVHTFWSNPLCVRVHPCPRLTVINPDGHVVLMDMTGAIDEPMFSRVKRSFVGLQTGSQDLNLPEMRAWGNLISCTINVVQTYSAGTLNFSCPGYTQPNFGTANFTQTIDLTTAGKRVIGPTGTPTSFGTDTLVAYPNWLAGTFTTTFAGISAGSNLTNFGMVLFEILTDQGLTRFPIMVGGPSQATGNQAWGYSDSSIQWAF